ncbi:MAG: calcium-binding protein [Pirellulaceae bacterium]
MSSKNRKKMQRKLSMETLEARELMAVDFGFSGGVLKIWGDAGENHVQVDYSGSKNVKVTTNSTVTGGFSFVPINKTKTVARSQLKEVRFYGYGGDDVFINNTSFKSYAYGGSGDDYLEGGDGRDVFYGQSGDDTLVGYGGNDALRGGTGHDTLKGGGGDDYLYGDKGNDKLYGQSGDDELKGAWGDDRLEGGSGDDYLVGGSNNDRYVFYGKKLGTDTIQGDSGYNTLDFRGFNQSVNVDIEKTSTQTVNSGDLKLKILEADAIDRVYGSAYSDVIHGNNLNNKIYGFDGNDELYGDGGNDYLYGGDGKDDLYGESGHDRLYGQSGKDYLSGGSGNDILDGGGSTDTLNGGSGYDVKRQSSSDVKIELPTDQPQNNWWSCGPNSAYRILKQYGHDVSYGKLKDQVKTNSLISFFRLGTTPKNLQEVMGRYQSTTLKSGASFDSLVDVVASGKPVAALLRVGTRSLTAKEGAALGAAVGGASGGVGGGVVGGILGGLAGAANKAAGNPISVPLMHWVAVSGVNKSAQTITYTDTNGGVYTVSYAKFQAKWNWSAGGVAGEALKAAGVKTRTMVY